MPTIVVKLTVRFQAADFLRSETVPGVVRERSSLFYFNRNDPALFVEKRFGIGWTVNMANPRSWFFLGAILLFVVASLALGLVVGRKG